MAAPKVVVAAMAVVVAAVAVAAGEATPTIAATVGWQEHSKNGSLCSTGHQCLVATSFPAGRYGCSF